MINLAEFVVKRGRWQIRISPNNPPVSQQGEMIELSNDGLYGIIEKKLDGSFVPQISFEKDSYLLQPLRFKENTEYEFSICIPYSKRDYERLKIETQNLIFPFENPSLEKVISINRLGVNRHDETRENYIITGRMNFKSYVGIVIFDFYNGTLNFCAEIVTEKMAQEEEFHTLLDELSDVNAELILRLDNPTGAKMKLSDLVTPSPMAEILHFRRIMREENLPLAIATIIGNPASRCELFKDTEQSAFVTEPDFIELQSNPMSLEWIDSGPLSRIFCGYTPTTLPAYKIEDDYDIVENRFVKRCIQELIIKLDTLDSRLDKKYTPSHSSIRKWREQLISFWNHPFWKEIGDSFSIPNSMIMRERIGYRDFLKVYISFYFGIMLQTNTGEFDANGDLKPIFDLYERWCLLQLNKALKSICEDKYSEQRIELISMDNGFSIDLKKGDSYFTKYCYSHNGQKLEIYLYYLRKFKKIEPEVNKWTDSYSGVFNPDYSIKIIKNNEIHWVHFDAKYRLDYKGWKDQVNEDTSVSQSKEVMYKRETLHVMHSYRDALLGTRSCCILYPGMEESPDFYVRQGDSSYRNSHKLPSVGAIPLKPSKGDLRLKQEDQLRSYLINIMLEIATNTSYIEELGFAEPD